MRPFDLFIQLNSWIDQQSNLPIEMQFYISVMFLGPPDDIIHEEKPFLQLKKRIMDRPTDQPTDGQTDPLIEMRGRI